jgi:hypothetical protein
MQDLAVERPDLIQVPPVAGAGLLFVIGAMYIAQTVHGRQALLFLLGGLAGVILYHAAFGFTSAWRVFISDRQGAGLRAQIGFGCNIGAYFSGVVSMSLHGWLWFAAGLAGSALGTHMRPWFRLSVERTR